MSGTSASSPAVNPTPADRTATVWFIVGGVLVALLLAFVVSRYASGSPDGLERVAADKGIDTEVTDHALGDWPFADYSTRGIDDEGLGTGVAGVIGVGVTFAVAFGAVWLVRLGRRDDAGQTRSEVDTGSV